MSDEAPSDPPASGAADPPLAGEPPPGGPAAPSVQVAWGYGQPAEPSAYPPYPADPAAYPGYPGAAIHLPTYAPAPGPQRSAAASVLGTLGIIFGALITLGGVLQVGCRALLSSLQVPNAKNPEIMRLVQLEMGLWGVMTVMSIALIVIGIGVWRHREVARKAMLVWAALALALIAGRMATQAFVIQPQAERHQREIFHREGAETNPQTEQVLRVSRAWAIWGDLVIWAPYPILSLVLLSRPRVRDRCA
jgi:hypothetical protein